MSYDSHSELRPSSPEEKPGEVLVWFGKHEGQRFEELPEGYKRWARNPDQSTYQWYEKFMRLDKAYEAWRRCADGEDSEELGPGSRRIWFGKYEGKRFDELDVWYKEWARHPDRSDSKWHGEFCQLYRDFERWREEQEGPVNPGNDIVWFGKFYNGLPFRSMYKARKHWKYLLSPENQHQAWYPWLQEHVVSYSKWLEGHKRGPQPEKVYMAVRDVGERLDARDDSLRAGDPDDDEYESDGGFVVPDDAPIEYESSQDVAEAEGRFKREGKEYKEDKEDEDEDGMMDEEDRPEEGRLGSSPQQEISGNPWTQASEAQDENPQSKPVLAAILITGGEFEG
ncbi:hypothetical protein K488DRAFT_85959 [Vararia minispora EC-137]|uniref:Uncharacterized protein n=1 Tax=Vararia minispora EC-137 TaxID=1314806 RepID=A0ACB8QKT4_9AGAM|nr:hypothetical protein K488DRAFT_85959 [Vararia minispora EC-137]